MRQFIKTIVVSFLILSTTIPTIQAFTLAPSSPSSSTSYGRRLSATTVENVEVCGFKDCKRAGGGPRLEKLVNSVLEEKNLLGTINVEICECQGECGYGPNLVVDGKIKNSVKGKDAVLQALGIDDAEEEKDQE